MEKPTLPKGTRDFGPVQMARRLYILDTIRTVFKKYGFQPLETPAMENLSTLTGKYGEEGDQLLFKILNSGDFLKDVDPADLSSKNSKKTAFQISEKGLRYDLTVPFARYVVMNQHELAMPFRRYQIQPVWRADRPQKGRYREFYQCDADVVGTDSLLCEAEIILMIREVFSGLGINDYQIKINHRNILTGLAELAGAKGNETAFFVALDKLDKIGEEKVKEELSAKGIDAGGTEKVFHLLKSYNGNIDTIKQVFITSGLKGIADLEKVFKLAGNAPEVEFDLSLARGLSYYTGCIFEVKVPSSGIGSVCGGGRYDNLTQAFGAKEKLSGVGISFGIDRIYDVLDALQIFHADQESSTRILFCHFDEATRTRVFELAGQIRAEGIAAEVYPDLVKMKKQLEYANKKSIPFAAIIGEEEIKTGTVTLKDLVSGNQENLPIGDLIGRLKK